MDRHLQRWDRVGTVDDVLWHLKWKESWAYLLLISRGGLAAHMPRLQGTHALNEGDAGGMNSTQRQEAQPWWLHFWLSSPGSNVNGLTRPRVRCLQTKLSPKIQTPISAVTIAQMGQSTGSGWKGGTEEWNVSQRNSCYLFESRQGEQDIFLHFLSVNFWG